MIYLILSASFDPVDPNKFIKILKIGFSEDLSYSNRITSYKNHNPSCKILNTIPYGDRQDEANLHGYFKKYRIFNKEWYEYNDEILDFFSTHTTKESLSELPYTPHQKDEISLRQQTFKAIEETYNDETLDKDIRDFLKNDFMMLSGFSERFRELCNNFEDRLDTILCLPFLEEYKYYIDSLGLDRCRANGFRRAGLDREIQNGIIESGPLLKEAIYKEFQINSRISKSEIKQRLREIYSRLGYNKTPKAVDLSEYFEIKYCQITNKRTGKRDVAFEIIKKK